MPPDTMLTWLRETVDPDGNGEPDLRWHLYTYGPTAPCGATPREPERKTTDQLPERPLFCQPCRRHALALLDEVA